MATIGDNRPNPDHVRQIHHMFAPDVLRNDLREQNYYENDIGERSVDDYLDTTDNFRQWIRKKCQGTNLDPENRRPKQLPNSPISDYEIEFTRLNNSASLSSLNVPTASSASLTILNSSTPTSRRPNRLSSATPRRSGHYTPTAILRQKQVANVNMAGKQFRLQKNSIGSFMPSDFSTPIRSERSKRSFFHGLSTVDRPQPEPVVSSSGDAHQTNKDPIRSHQSTPINDSNRTLTGAENVADTSTPTIIPETQENDTLIPETQDDRIPETQEVYIPETQENQIPETQEVYIPETQEDDIPATQEIAASNPVLAQVSEQNTNQQQAEPRENDTNRTTRSKILARPPLRNQSQIATPSKGVPSSAASERPPEKTPSRIPVTLRTPRVNGMVTKLSVPNVLNGSMRPNIDEVTSSNHTGTEAGQTIVVITSPVRQTAQPATVPLPVASPSNMTINVNVNGSIPQSPKQTTQTINANDQNGNSTANNATKTYKGMSNSSSDSLMTNDSDSDENRLNKSPQYETPTGDTNGNSVRRKLFVPQPNNETVRRSATFNKIDNLTRTIGNGDSIASPPQRVQTRTRSTIRTSQNRTETPRSQTFVKPKQSLQNATYDVPGDNDSAALSDGREFYGFDTDDFVSNQTENGQTMVDIPSAARLDSMRTMTDDEDSMNQIQSHIVNGSSDRSNDDESISRNVNNTKVDPKSNAWNPIVLVPRLDMNDFNFTVKSIANLTNISCNGRPSQPFGLFTPPGHFKDDNGNRLQNDGLIVEVSPATGQRNLRQSMSNASERPKRGKKRSAEILDENLAIVEKSKEYLKTKPRASKPMARRLTSTEELYHDQTIEDIENFVTSIANRNTTTVTDDGFKVPDVPEVHISTASRKSKSKSKSKNASVASASTTMNDDFNVSVHIEPLNVDDLATYTKNLSGVSSASIPVEQSDSSSKRKSQSKSKATTAHSKKTNKSDGKTKVSEATVDVDIENESEEENADADSNQKNARNSPTKKAKAVSKSKKVIKPATKGGPRKPKSSEVSEETGSDNAETASEVRRSSRDRNSVFNAYRQDYLKKAFTQEIIAANKRKSTQPISTVAQTAPVLSAYNMECEPPRKKKRAQTDIPHNPPRSSSGGRKSVKPVKPSTLKKSTESDQSESEQTDVNHIQVFTDDLKENNLKKMQFWKEILNLSHINNITQEDVIHINTVNGTIEVTNSNQMEYRESDGVYYGCVPTSSNRQYGFMRFGPGTKKPKGKCLSQLDLHVLNGEFTLETDNSSIDIYGATDVIIPKGSHYGLVNRGKNVGVIQFTYPLIID